MVQNLESPGIFRRVDSTVLWVLFTDFLLHHLVTAPLCITKKYTVFFSQILLPVLEFSLLQKLYIPPGLK